MSSTGHLRLGGWFALILTIVAVFLDSPAAVLLAGGVAIVAFLLSFVTEAIERGQQ